jgi:nucleoside-diphosphate-sugar epimerase
MGGAHILIAGCGDLGWRTAQRLLARPEVARVYGLRRHPPSPTAALTDAKWHWLSADFGDPQSLLALPADITHVMFTPTPSERSQAAYERIFLLGQQHLHAALHSRHRQASATPLARWLFVSSSAVYGDHQGDWIDENTPTAPQGFNGQVLCAAEAWLRAHQPNACILRLAGLYGPGRIELLRRLRAGQARAPVEVPHIANRIHIDDAASACEILLMHACPDALYLGVDDHPQPLHTLYTALAALLGAPAPLPGPAPAGVGSKRMRNARLHAAGWSPRYPQAINGYRDLLNGAS